MLIGHALDIIQTPTNNTRFKTNVAFASGTGVGYPVVNSRFPREGGRGWGSISSAFLLEYANDISDKVSPNKWYEIGMATIGCCRSVRVKVWNPESVMKPHIMLIILITTFNYQERLVTRLSNHLHAHYSQSYFVYKRTNHA